MATVSKQDLAPTASSALYFVANQTSHSVSKIYTDNFNIIIILRAEIDYQTKVKVVLHTSWFSVRDSLIIHTLHIGLLACER